MSALDAHPANQFLKVSYLIIALFIYLFFVKESIAPIIMMRKVTFGLGFLSQIESVRLKAPHTARSHMKKWRVNTPMSRKTGFNPCTKLGPF